MFAARQKTTTKTDQELREAAAAASITINRQPGAVDGQAQRIINGKVQKIAPHAVAAWKVRGGAAALVLVLQSAKGKREQQYVLHYYDLSTGRRRVLGPLPFSSATIVETALQDDRWAFALTGTESSGSTTIILGNDQAIPGRIPKAAVPHFDAEGVVLHFSQAGQQKFARVATLLGTELRSIFVLQPSNPASARYLQVFPNGEAIGEFADGAIRKGQWTTDGEVVSTSGLNLTSAIPIAELTAVKGVPAGQRFSVRLLQPLSSRVQHEGDIVSTLSITPIVVAGELLIPAGTTFEGKVTQANSVGWGFKHETASLTLDWFQAKLSDGRQVSLSAKTLSVENAQEKVNAKGKIEGVRATGTIGNSAENGVLTFAGIDPVAYVFASAAGPAVLGFAEPEILYPAGTELILEISKPLLTDAVYRL